jgi:hypothetical protein
MALVLADRVKETTTTTGTGTVTLLGASTGFQSFAAVGNANTTYYTIADQTGSNWEVGIGTYTSSGTTLSRTTVLASSNSGSLVTFTAGTKDVFVTYPSSRSIYANGTTLTASNSSILPVASGGSGAATLTGVLKGNGTSAFTAATAGTDYVAPGTATTFTALQTFAGTSSNADIKTSNILETATVSATAATGTINYDVTTQSVLYYTTNASGNFTLNFRGSSGTSLNTVMATGESLSATFLVTNGSTAYYNSAVTIDGNSVTPKWQGGSAPTSGNASSIDSYTYVVVKTGSAAFTVLASQTKFA